ncbi:MAG: RluA family pseudouridine synthase [Spirochaetales bacterium]|nr:RluA family pseudouridine synthase [Spirochaetales bacterium]
MKIEILYSDDSIVVLNKPAGLLSVPGRGEGMTDSAALRIREMFPICIVQPSVHRLDMDTSGLMVFALTTGAHRNLSIQFQNGEVRKKYIAILEGEPAGDSGEIRLSFRLDPENRPYQVYDPVQGKAGITLWKKLEAAGGKTRVEFTPLTGRTHQLRLHSSHPAGCGGSGGLGCPIIGDRLYGSSSDREHAEGIRILLHASDLEFLHPTTTFKMSFRSPAPF